MATYSLLGLPFAIIRPIVALITGVIGGSVSNFFDRKEKRTQALEAESQTPERKGFSERIITVFRYGFIEMIQSIGKWLLIGLAFAALLAVVIPDDFFSGQAGRGITGMLLILAASVPLYVCATGSIPIAAVLMLKGVSPGAALVFLMAGPATNIATISVIAKQMGRKSLAIYLATIIGGAVLSGLLIDAFLPASWFLNPLADAGHHHESGNIIATIAGVIMLALILNAFILSLLSKRKKIPQMDKDQIIQIKVEGMTCMHCKAAVEKELSQVEGINSVEANHQSGVVSLDGKVDSWEKVEAVIRKAGYVFKGKM
jgi:copper chaperone CopZ